MTLNIYLSGEIHTDWRAEIIAGAADLDVEFSGPVTDHAASDDCGVTIMGAEPDKFWHDNKGANLTPSAPGTGWKWPIVKRGAIMGHRNGCDIAQL